MEKSNLKKNNVNLFLRSVLKFIEEKIQKIEDFQIHPLLLLGYIFFVIQIRAFLECFSDFDNPVFIQNGTRILIHYTLWFFVILILFTLIAHFFTKERLTKIFKMFSFSLPLLWIAPLLDLALQGRTNIGYFRIYTWQDLVKKFFLWNWGDPINSPGMTSGMGIEVVIIFTLLGMYMYQKTKNLVTAGSSLLVFYSSAFFMGSLPFIIPLILNSINLCNFVGNNSFLLSYNLDYISSIILFPLLILLIILFFKEYDREKCILFLKNISLTRVVHYLLLLNAGMALGILSNVQKIRISYLSFFFVFLANFVVFASWEVSKLINDYFDQVEDSISNKKNPFLSNIVEKGELLVIYSIMVILILWISSFLSYPFFFINLLVMGVSFIYSCPPLRLKKIIFLSHMCLGLAAGLVFLGGLFLIKGNVPLSETELNLFLVVLFIFSLGSHLKDIKDYEGDTKGKIITLPTLLGERKAKKVISIIISGLFFFSITIVHLPLLIPLAILDSIGIFYFINRKKYSEVPVFLIYFSFFIVCIVSLIF